MWVELVPEGMGKAIFSFGHSSSLGDSITRRRKMRKDTEISHFLPEQLSFFALTSDMHMVIEGCFPIVRKVTVQL